MQEFVKKFLLVVAAVFLLGITVYYFDESLFRVASVTVALDPENDQQLIFSRIKSQLHPQLASIKGKYFWEVSLTELMGMVTADKRVESVNVFRRFPNKIELMVKPHEPLFSLMGLDGRLLPVARDASLLPSLKFNEAPDKPVLRGMQFHENKEMLGKAVEMITQIPKTGLFSQSTISEIYFDHKKGFVLSLVNSDVEVIIGFSEFAYKAGLIEKVLNYMQDQQMKGRVIDARFSKKVVVRLRNDS